MTEYNQKIRYLQPATPANPLSNSTSDPFKLALYKIIGRADLNKRNIPSVTDKTEHWLWLQLCLVHESRDPTASSSNIAKYGLRDLANVLRKFGENHWDPKRDRPGLYFQVLLMSGQFERVRRSWSLPCMRFRFKQSYRQWRSCIRGKRTGRTRSISRLLWRIMV